MKILLTSDWHLDAVTAGVPRLDEIDPYIEELLEVIVREKINFVFHLGDLFDPGSMLGALYTATVIDIAGRLADSGADAVVWVAGNHDVIESSRGATTLSPLAAANRQGRLGAGDGADTYVFERPTFAELVGFDVPNLRLVALPYVARAVERMPGFEDLRAAAFAEAAALGEKWPLVVIGHLTVPGALVGSETTDMPRGRDLDFPFEDVARLNPALVASGHYHKAQVVSHEATGLDIVIPGSPFRLTFGERDDKRKGFVIVEI